MKAEIEAALTEAFDTDLADAITVFTLIDRKAGVYDPTTGTVSSSEATYATRGIYSPYTTLEMAQSGGAIDSRDYKVLIMLKDIAVTPTTNMILAINGAEYKIVSISSDPINVAYTLRVR